MNTSIFWFRAQALMVALALSACGSSSSPAADAGADLGADLGASADASADAADDADTAPTVCDAEAFAVAAATGHVRIGACAFEVEGVFAHDLVIEGLGPSRSVLRIGAENLGLIFVGGAHARIEGVAIESEGLVAVFGKDAASLELRDLLVTATRGVAIGADGVADVRLSGVRVAGSVDARLRGTPLLATTVSSMREAADATCASPAPTPECTPRETRAATCDGCTSFVEVCDACGAWRALLPSVGVWINHSDGDGHVEIENTIVTGFSRSAALVAGAGGSVDNFAAYDNAGMAFFVVGAASESLTLRESTLENTMHGPFGFGSGLVVVGGANVSSEMLVVRENDGAGLLLREASGSHTGLVVRGNENVGVVLDTTTDVRIGDAEAGVLIEGNRYIGVLANNSVRTTVENADIRSTRRDGVPELPLVELGEGLAVLGTSAGLRVADVRLVGNGRFGLAIGLPVTEGASGSEPVAGVYTDVSIDEGDSLEALGFVVGRFAPEAMLLGVYGESSRAAWSAPLAISDELRERDDTFFASITVVAMPVNLLLAAIPSSDWSGVIGPIM